ncbi:ComF protein, partial [human gut metagenome]
MGKKSETFIKSINYILKGILEIIYPRESHCIICGEEDSNGL